MNNSHDGDNLDTNAENIFKTFAKTAGLEIPNSVSLLDAANAYKNSIINDKIKYKSGLDPAKRRAIDEFVQAIGPDFQTTSINVDIVERYVNLLHCLPKGFELHELRDDLWSYLNDSSGLQAMHEGTVKGRLINLRAFFRDMRKRKFIDQNLLDLFCTPLRDRISLI